MGREGFHPHIQNNSNQFTGENFNQVNNQPNNSFQRVSQDFSFNNNFNNANIQSNNPNNMDMAIDRTNILKSYNAGVMRPNDNVSYQGGIAHIAVPTQPSYLTGYSPRVADPYAHAYYPYMYGHDKWPYRVESAFTSALRLIIKNGTSKIKIRNKNYGRNELISIYIKYHTGEVRTKKQISSHIQVWKKSILNKLSTNVRLTALDQEILELIEKGPIQNEETLKLFYSVFDEIIDACSKEDIDSNPNVVATMNAIPKEQYYEKKNAEGSYDGNEHTQTPKNKSSSPHLEQKSTNFNQPQNRLPLHTSLSSGSATGYEFNKPLLATLNDYNHGSPGIENINYQRPGLQDSHMLSHTSSTPSTAPMSGISASSTDFSSGSLLSSKWALHTQRSDRDFIDVYDSHLPSSRDLRKGAEPLVAAMRDDLGRGAPVYGQNEVRAVEQTPVYSIVLPQPIYQQGNQTTPSIPPATPQAMSTQRTQAPLPAGYVNCTVQQDGMYQSGSIENSTPTQQPQAGIGINSASQISLPHPQHSKVTGNQYYQQGYQYTDNKNISQPQRDVNYVPSQYSPQVQQPPTMGVVYQQPMYSSSGSYESQQSNTMISQQGMRQYGAVMTNDSQGILSGQGPAVGTSYGPNYVISGSTRNSSSLNNNGRSNSSSPPEH